MNITLFIFIAQKFDKLITSDYNENNCSDTISVSAYLFLYYYIMKLVNTNALGWERLEDGTSIESNKNSKITKFSHNGSLEDELSSIAQLKDAQSADAIKTFFYEAKSQKQTINKEVINAIQKSNRSLLVYKGLLSTISSTIQQNQNPFNRFKQTYQNSSTFSFSRKLIDSKLYNEQNNKVEQ